MNIAVSSRLREPVPTAPARLRRAGLLPIADGYLLKQVLAATFRGLIWFAGLFFLFAIVTSAKSIREEQISFLMVVRIVSLELPRILLFTVPASLLYGTVQAFVEMSARGEITALYAGGMSLGRMLRGPIAVAVLATVGTYYIQEVLVPQSQLAKSDLKLSLIRSVGKRNGFNFVDYSPTGGIQKIVRADSFDPVTRVFIVPIIQVFRPDMSLQYQVKADRAFWDVADGWWIFEGHGRMISSPDLFEETTANQTAGTDNHFQQMILKTDIIPDPGRVRVEAYGMGEQLNEQNYEMVSMHDLRVYRSHLVAKGDSEVSHAKGTLEQRIASATYGIHDKIATPLLCLALVLIGVPLGIQQRRTANAAVAMGLSMLVLVVYYMLETTCTQLGKGGGLPPMVAAYLPLALMSAVGATLVWRKS